MKRFLLSLLALAALPCLLHANGDPVISYSASIRSCNPVPLKVSEVQVVREDLNIKMGLPYTDVRVAYRLKNNSARDIHVDYGFPVDFSGRMDTPEGFGTGGEYESLYETGIAGRAVRGVHFRLDGRELEWTRSDEIVRHEIEVDEADLEEGEDNFWEECRLWTYTVLDIPAGATVTLEVDYSVLSCHSIAMGALAASPLSRYFYDDLSFEYDLSPAQHWGDGSAGELHIKVDCTALPDGLDMSVGANWLQRNGKVFTVTERNFDFAQSDILLAGGFYREYGDPDKRFPSWGDPLKTLVVPSSEYRLSVSGAQDKYPASNLQDDDLATAWVAPGNGVGATVSIDFPTPRRVSDIGIWNGYHKSASLWAANSRIRRMRVEVTRADGYVDTWETDPEDWGWNNTYTLYESRTPRFGEITLLPVTNLLRQMDGRETGVDEDGIYQYDKVPFTSEYVSRIRLTVLEVDPGTKYKDLCLSDLIVLDGFRILE